MLRTCRFAFLAVLVLVAGACSSDGASGGVGDSIDTAELIVAVSSLGSETLIPSQSTDVEDVIPSLTNDSLIWIDDETEALGPGLAESWSVSEDLLTWTFKLRPDVEFHDGWGTVTAEDVKFTWGLYTTEDSTSVVAEVLRQAVGNDLEKNFKIISPLEFSVTADKPVSTLPSQLSDLRGSFFVHSQKYWEEEPEQAEKHIVGTGPFEFVEIRPGVELVLEASEIDHPFRETPAFDRVLIRSVAEDATRLAQVQSGVFDLAPITLQQLGEAQGLNIITIPNVGILSVMLGGMWQEDPELLDQDAPWIQADSPEKGLAVRQALATAIDRETMIESISGGEGEPVACALICYPGAPWVDPSLEVPTYDPEEAKALLAEGGYPDGFDITLMMFEQGGRTGVRDTGEAVAGYWEEIGITVNRDPVDFDTFAVDVLGDRGGTGAAWAYVTPRAEDAGTILAANYNPEATYAHLYSTAINEGLSRLSTEPDPEARHEILSGVATELAQDLTAMPLYTYTATYVTSEKVGSWSPTPAVERISRLETVAPPE